MRRTLLSAIALIAIQMCGTAWGQPAPSADIAPNGKLRSGSISIRVLGGVAEPVGKFIAAKLGVSYEPVMYPKLRQRRMGHCNRATCSGCARQSRFRRGPVADRSDLRQPHRESHLPMLGK